MLLGVALGVLLLVIQPVRAQEAPPTLSNAVTAFDYSENGTGPITTYNARDPENKPVFWTLGGADAADFTIDGGVLRFSMEKFPDGPNYEVPTDRANDEDESGAITPAVTEGTPCSGEGACNNVYKVTVRFGAGGEDGAPVIGDDYAGDDLGEIDLTVTVTNVDEDGKVAISPRQPQVGTRMTAILTDPDNVAPAAAEWQWASSDSENGPWEDIPEFSDEMTYRPTPDDENKWLRVTVVYVDRAGAEPKSVPGVSEFAVRKDIVTSNQPPKFPDQSTLIGGTSPGRTTTDRFISEAAGAGTNVGAAVTAFDDATEIEVITYSLRDPAGTTGGNTDGEDDDTNPDTPSESDGHAASFNIHEKTGQITVSARAMLDAEAAAGSPGNVDTPYTVVVRAIDGDGDVENITVRIYVLPAPEPPMIDRDYVTGRVPTTGGVSAGDRAPTEMSHYEADRTPRSATRIDADLDSSVLDDADPPELVGDVDAATQPATYFATDPEGDTINWSLAGDDAGRFIFEPSGDRFAADDTEAQKEEKLDGYRKATGASVTLAFRNAPDFENPADDNGDNVYEVTIVASDAGGSDELPVTVKVINSTDDNAPGSVKFSIRQPEVAIRFQAEFSDPDSPVSQVNWQWYRSQTTSTTACDGRTPPATDSDAHRVFLVDPTEATVGGELVDQVTIDTAVWTKIPGASGTGSTARYTPEANADQADLTDVGRCLRATFTYRDSVDRTFSGADVATTDVDETLEATWAGVEQPVKAIDENNEAPTFRVGGVIAGDLESVYRSRVVENAAAEAITEAYRAVDPADGEDDDSDTTQDGPVADNDLLMYSLSGRDASAFSITGTLNDATPNDATDDGVLTFKGGANYEAQREYRVRITATDPSGDSGYVDVIVDVDNVNERPSFTMGETSVSYPENETIVVGTYKAVDPEGSGLTYSLVTVAIDAIDDDSAGDVAAVAADAFADEARFEIGSVTGKLTFKMSPNFEDPDDVAEGTSVADNNVYHVTVRAEVADDTNPRHFTTRQVMVTVVNVNEAPMFSDTMQPLQITENPDDPEKEPPLAPAFLYQLNRGAGIPSPANPPAAPNLDVGIPVVAIDDDNNGTDPIPTADTGSPVQLPDALVYELMGPDVDYFDIVEATGQILTVKKLDYEAKNEFMVTVKATDVAGLYDTIDMTINVIDVDEVPVPDILRLSGGASYTVAENSTDDLGEYTVAAGGDATPDTWSLEGADKDHFMLEGTGMSRMLKFTAEDGPDYDNPRGEPMSDTNTNTYMVTVKVADSSASDVFDIVEVTVMVTNVDELGMLPDDASVSYAENGTDAVGTYAITGDGTMNATADWSVDGADKDHFMLEGTGMSRMLKFASAPDYEAMADDGGDNTYNVTVKAMAGGEEDTMAVTVMVTNVDELGMLPDDASVSYAENGTDAVGTYAITGDGTMNATADWSVDGADKDHFMLEGTGMSRMLKFASAPDYEAMADDGGDNTYNVTVKAMAGGEEDTMAVTVMVTNVDELGMLPDDASVSYAENGTDAVGTYAITGDGTMNATADWSVDGADKDHFMLEGTGMSRMLKFASAPDYEAMADDGGDNTYNVTVKAMAGGEEDTMAVTVMVTNANDAPMFDEGATATRSIAENTDAGMDIGTPVTASDQDGDMLTYALGGTDAASFTINGSTGQLMTQAALDYETKDSYMVTVTADDGMATDTIDVTINIIDVAVENLAPMFDEGATATRSIDENTAAGMNVGDPVTATDPDEGDKVAYTLSGTDAASFTINGSTGQLMTQAALDHETKDSYMVTVTAMDADSATDTIDVTINVNNVDETGTLELSSMSPIAGTALTATLTDLDGVVAVVDWQWSRSMTMDGTFEHIAEETMTYTPSDDDVGYYLQVVAKYTDGHGSGKSETEMTGKVSAAPNPVLVKHDANENGRIDRDEAIAAVRSYQAGEISRSEVIQVLQLYRGN